MRNQPIAVLIKEWVRLLESKAVCDYRKAVIGNFDELLIKAHEQCRPVTFVGISCQPWTKIPGTDPDVDRLIPPIDMSHEKPRRFTNEVSSFFNALTSFGIEYSFRYSVSDIEAKMHIKLGNMGQVVHNQDALCNVSNNQLAFIETLKEAGVNVQGFSETDELMKKLKANSLRDLQEKMAGQNPSYTRLLDSLYELDFTTVFPGLVGDNLAAWLDVQTFSYRDLIEDFEAKANKFAPNIPLVSVIRNCGNWNYRGRSANTFLTKQEVFATICGLNVKDKLAVPTTTEGWRKKLVRLKTDKLSQVWYLVSGENVISRGIESAQEIANKLVEALAL